jgi:hypothetical protein
MAAGVGVMVVRSGTTVGIVVAGVRRIVIVVMPAAFGGMLMVMDMIQREHTSEESGDHAEHQEP